MISAIRPSRSVTARHEHSDCTGGLSPYQTRWRAVARPRFRVVRPPIGCRRPPPISAVALGGGNFPVRSPSPHRLVDGAEDGVGPPFPSGREIGSSGGRCVQPPEVVPGVAHPRQRLLTVEGRWLVMIDPPRALARSSTSPASRTHSCSKPGLAGHPSRRSHSIKTLPPMTTSAWMSLPSGISVRASTCSTVWKTSTAKSMNPDASSNTTNGLRDAPHEAPGRGSPRDRSCCSPSHAGTSQFPWFGMTRLSTARTERREWPRRAVTRDGRAAPSELPGVSPGDPVGSGWQSCLGGARRGNGAGARPSPPRGEVVTSGCGLSFRRFGSQEG